MSQNQQPQLPSVEDAGSVVFDAVEGPIFFQKLANAYGIVPKTEAEQQALLKIACQLEQIEMAQAAQQTAANSPIEKAASALSEFMGEVPSVKQAQVEQELNNKASHALKIAAQVMQDPAVYRSIAALKQNEASQYQQRVLAGV